MLACMPVVDMCACVHVHVVDVYIDALTRHCHDFFRLGLETMLMRMWFSLLCTCGLKLWRRMVHA